MVGANFQYIKQEVVLSIAAICLKKVKDYVLLIKPYTKPLNSGGNKVTITYL